jgi:4-amino-4-deoxy-L-arabinose transferase-like glycosyltransferase
MRTLFSVSSPFLLILIICFAAIIRLVGIGSIPSGFHNDEASFFLNAVAIKETGHDEDGRKYPFYLNSFIDPKPALYSYLQIPFITLLGKTTTAARVPGVIFGIGSIIVIYFLITALLNRKAALLMTLLVSINPWHIILSRGTQEVIMSFFFSLLATLLLIKLFQKNAISISYTALFVCSTFLALYSYHSAKIFLPLLFLSFIFYLGGKNKKTLFISCVIILVCISTLLSTTSHGGLVRAKSISILSDPHTQLVLDEEIRTATPLLPHSIIRIVHNKVVNYSLAFASNYSEYFSGSFLFFKGGEPARLSVPFMGLFYLIESWLFLYGIFIGFRDERYRRISFLFMVWLFLSPASGALTIQEIPSVTRTAFLLVPFIFFVVIALVTLFEKRKEKATCFVMCLVMLGYIGGIGYFTNQYAIQSQAYHPWSRNYADEVLVTKVRKNQQNYKKIFIITGRDSYVYFVLANMIPLETLQKSYPARSRNTYTFTKYTFSKLNECLLPKDATTLFVIGIECKVQPHTGFTVIDTANYKDTVPEYQLVTYNKAEDRILSK